MITQLDFCILNAIQSLRSPFLDFIMPYITYLGSGGAVWIVTAVVLLIFKKTRKAGVAILLSLLIGLIVSTLGLKNLIARERPFNTAGALLDAPSLLIGVPSGQFSFPSGHTVSSFAAATVIMMYNRKWGVPALILAALIALSRLYLYVHFPSDILAGVILGVLFAIAALKIVNTVWRKYYETKLSDSTEQNN